MAFFGFSSRRKVRLYSRKGKNLQNSILRTIIAPYPNPGRADLVTGNPALAADQSSPVTGVLLHLSSQRFRIIAPTVKNEAMTMITVQATAKVL